MASLTDRSVLRRLGVLWCLGFGVLLLQAQRSATPETSGATTQQRLESEVWWPTMSTAPLEAYRGTAGCASCHADEAGANASGGGTAMSRAASRAGDIAFRGVDGKAKFGELEYSLRAVDQGREYAVAHETETASQRLEWVMGAGDLGRTFVYQRDGRWFQSRISEYREAPNLDVTTGLSISGGMDAGSDLAVALGKVLTGEEVRHCFSCHTVHATSSKGFNPSHAEIGLGCEACHGPGAVHVQAKSKTGIFNPARLSPADSIDFCGACHRTFGDVTQAANPANDASVVRFQPYRLEKSRCWRETRDARLTCVACHDPHEPLVREDVSYDKQCLGCHASGVKEEHSGKVCPTRATSKCVSCHMPKVKVASMHGEFTDHFIRVAKAGEGFPR